MTCRVELSAAALSAAAFGGPRSLRAHASGFATWLATLLTLLVPSIGSAAPLRVGVTSVGAVLEIKNGKPTGPSVAIWENLAGRLGLQTEYVVLPTIDAAIDAAAKGDVDLFLGPIAVTREREQRLDFTHALLHSGLRIAIRDESGGSWLEPLGMLLSRRVLGLVAALVCLTLVVGNLLWWCERKANGGNFPPDWRRGAWEGTWWGISTLMTGGCENKHVDTVAGRLLATAWTLVGTGLVALFTGSLAATLTAERISGAIR